MITKNIYTLTNFFLHHHHKIFITHHDIMTLSSKNKKHMSSTYTAVIFFVLFEELSQRARRRVLAVPSGGVGAEKEIHFVTSSLHCVPVVSITSHLDNRSRGWRWEFHFFSRGVDSHRSSVRATRPFVTLTSSLSHLAFLHPSCASPTPFSLSAIAHLFRKKKILVPLLI